MPSDAALALTVRAVTGPAPIQPKQPGGEEPAAFAALIDAGETADALVTPETAQAPAAPTPAVSVAATQPVHPALAQTVVPAVAVKPTVQEVLPTEAPPAEPPVIDQIAVAQPDPDAAELPEPITKETPELLAEIVPLPDVGAAPVQQVIAQPVVVAQQALPANDAAPETVTQNIKAKAVGGATRSLAAGKAEIADEGTDQAAATVSPQAEALAKSGGRSAKSSTTAAVSSNAESANDTGARPVVAQASFADTPIPVADATLRTIYQAQQGPAASANTPVIQAHGGQIGREMGALIKRQIVSGREEVTVRLDPPELGRIHIRLSFETAGELRAVVATESTAALDLLRRDVNQLDRALAEAGVRTDGQSFRFDERQAGSGFDRSGQQASGRDAGSARGAAEADETLPTRAAWRGINANGRVDMIA
jgi:flagellar hook-length control protein FliK